MNIALVVAVADNGCIGRDNRLPWHLPEDLKYFKRVTLGKPVIMGRHTFESIGKPLPGRTNVVVSRNPAWQHDGVTVADSLPAALRLATAQARQDGQDEVMIIGGARLYAEALPLAQRLYYTRVHATVEGDAFFPALDWAEWQLVSREDHCASAGNPHEYSFCVYRRL